jgi:protease IV
MSLTPDVLVDRRRLKRRLRLWQGIALVAIVAFVAAAIIIPNSNIIARDSIARFDVSGVIVEDGDRDATLRAIAKADHIHALIVHIDSPGGTVVGGEDLFNTLREVARTKPVVAVMGTVATSAAYMTAVGGDRIFAREGSITGSIGVILQSANIVGLLDKLGIQPETIKSSPLKAVPSPLEPLTEEGRAATRDIVLDMYDFFVDLVAERRDMPRDALLPLADGRIYTGRQAVANGLIDAIGDERSAVAWLVEARSIPAGLPVRTVTVERETGAFDELFESITGKSLFSNALLLDGLISLWQPSGS